MAMDPPRRTTVGRISVTEIDTTRRPGYSRPPPAELDPVPTVRPPAFHPQPIPRGMLPRPAAAPPARREAEIERTLVGPVGAQESDDGDRPSTVQALTAADRLAELAAERGRESAELRRQLEAARVPLPAPAPMPSFRPRGPTISLGDAKWWVLVIGALAAGSAGLSALIVRWHELDRPTASQAQVTDVKQDVQETSEQANKQAAQLKAAKLDSDQRARIVAAFLCEQGLRANGLDCDALLSAVEFQPLPLNPRVHGAPQWHTSSKWPALPDPPLP